MLRLVIPAQEVMFFFSRKVCLFNPFQREPVLKQLILFIFFLKVYNRKKVVKGEGTYYFL